MNVSQEKIINGFPFVAYSPETFTDHDMLFRSNIFYEWMNKRKHPGTLSHGV